MAELLTHVAAVYDQPLKTERVEELMCEYCGKPFRRFTSNKSEHNLCSRACTGAWLRQHRQLVAVTCGGCGAVFDRDVSGVKTVNYCTKRCYKRTAAKKAA